VLILAKILIVDDEEKIRQLIAKYAKFEWYQTVEAANGVEAIEKCNAEEFDIIIMDIMMPELDGLSACREIRKKRDTPVLMLSARGEEYDRIHGFELGVDDYVVKPFSPRELMMRVNAILKRVHANSQPQKVKFQKDGLVVDFTARQVTIDGKKVNLSPKEYELLFFLVRNRGIALDREKLICEIWGYDFYGDDRTLDTHIKLLRKSLGPYSKQIVTLRGVGYRFDA
jgi:two-component system response regulator ResD